MIGNKDKIHRDEDEDKDLQVATKCYTELGVYAQFCVALRTGRVAKKVITCIT